MMMKNAKRSEVKSTAPRVLKTPDKHFSQNPFILSSPSAESREKTWADVVRTPSTTHNKATANPSKTSNSDLSDLSDSATETSPPVRPKSNSDGSFQSFQTIIGDVNFNTQILLTIDPEKKEEQVSLYFTSLRPKTILGATQGHHVIAHRLVLEFCSKVALNSRLVEIPKKIKKAFERIIPNIRKLRSGNGPLYPDVPDAINYLKCDESMSERLETELGFDHREAYETGMRQKRVNKVVGYLSDILIYYNAMRDVTHARNQSVGGKNQGLEHSIIVALNAISRFLSFNKPATSAQVQEFYQQAVEKNGEFVDGMFSIFGIRITQIRDSFKGVRKEDDFFDAFKAKANDAKLIGNLIEGLFDFSKTEDRELNELEKMSKRCIEMSLVAFPGLQILDQRKIVQGFLEKVSINQKWNLNPEIIKEIEQKILGLPIDEAEKLTSIQKRRS